MLHAGSQQLHGLLQRLRERLEEVQDRPSNSWLRFHLLPYSYGMFSIDGLSTVPLTRFGRGDRAMGGGDAARQWGWNKLQAARRFKVWQAHGLHRQVW